MNRQSRRKDAKQKSTAEALHRSGVAALERGDLGTAIRDLRRSVAECATNPYPQYNLGNALRAAQQGDKAVACYRRALALNPRLHKAWVNLAATLTDLKRHDEAITAYRSAVILDPSDTEALNCLGILLREVRQLEAAREALEQAIARRPDFAIAHNNLGNVFRDLRMLGEALACYRAAIDHAPDLVAAHFNLGTVLKDVNQHELAAKSCLRAIALKPDFAEAFNNLGNAYKDLGRVNDALGAYRAATAINPRLEEVHRNIISTVLYTDAVSPGERFEAHQRFEEACAAQHYPADINWADLISLDSGKLRIGYLSGDLREHPVARNLLPLVAAHDRSKVEVWFYSCTTATDAVTEQFQALADGWRDIRAMDNMQAAELIRDDGIHILVSLAGRFDSNRPLICAHRPAPVQVSFHDTTTSGLRVMDAIIADPIMVPRHGSERFVERVMRLPSFYLHAPIPGAPEVNPLPMLVNGYPTFGSFNNPAKLSDATLRVWAALLTRLPTARLKLKYKNWFSHSSLATRIRDHFTRAGIAPERIDLSGGDETTLGHLANYHAIDIALDPFPFNGSTTTFEALWMGVPVVTLLGDTMVGRWGASMLKPVGLGQLVADTQGGYIGRCRELASNPYQLAALRPTLRQRVMESQLCDAAGKARHIERIYRALWGRWRLTAAHGL